MSRRLIRWAQSDDAAVFSSVVRRTQHALYTAIISHDEIDAVHDGRVPMRKTWEHRRLEPIGLLVAEVKGQVVGGANLVRLREGDAELTTMYVLREYEGRGIGHALWDACLAALRERAIGAMEVWAAPEATWATRFYERRGCSACGTGDASIGEHRVPHVGYRIAIR